MNVLLVAILLPSKMVGLFFFQITPNLDQPPLDVTYLAFVIADVRGPSKSRASLPPRSFVYHARSRQAIGCKTTDAKLSD
jgi:hypothetical protein